MAYHEGIGMIFTLEKLKTVLGMLLFTLFFGLLTGFLIADYMDEYNLFAAEKQEVTIIDKVGSKGLFTPPAYFVRVELPSGEISPYLNRISKGQINKFDQGDTLTGFSTYSGEFSTIRDFFFDSIFFAGGILLFGLFTLVGIFVLLTEIPAVDRFINEKTFMGRTSTGNGMKILTVTMAVFIYFSARFLYNLFHKLVPFMKTNTEAKIIDTYSDVSFRRYEDSIYQFTLLFEDNAGNKMEVIKDVTRNTFDHYSIGNSLSITYRNLNPYDIFIHPTTMVDAIQTLFYTESFVYLCLIAVVLFTGYVLLKRKRDREKITKAC